MLQIDRHAYFMGEALKEAERAFAKDEVPVGAIVVYKDRIIARAHNQVEQLTDATAHAEMIAVTSASNHFGSKFLIDCSIYVTLEPCLMCASSLVLCRISNLFYGASDSKIGFSNHSNQLFPQKISILNGVLKAECKQILKRFFEEKRNLNHPNHGD